MKKQIFNPYLPDYEYIPDGEPHVFDGRLYIYGSHDRYGSDFFCDNDYVLWSAPLSDLSDWTCHGTVFKKQDDPLNGDLNPLFAPDVCQGKDGRYYLFYCPCNTKSIGVAVSDRPDGRFRFLGHVHHKDGELLGRREHDPYPFDPAIFIDGDRVFLYIGFAPDLSWDFMEKEFGTVPLSSGAYVVELEDDMVTVKAEAEKISIEDCDDKNHDFFEAASIRKYDGRYYFIYSSWNSHELAYAMADTPKGPFTYKGILHDNGDIGLVEEKDRVSYTGNNHGSLVFLNGNYYIFGHRQTNYCTYARQGVAERIFMKEDGTFDQAEMTSCGLNDGPLLPEGSYRAAIACHLQSKEGAIHYLDTCDEKIRENHPAFCQDGADREEDPNQYIHNMKDGAIAGFRYFSYRKELQISVITRGDAGAFEVRTSLHGPILGLIRFDAGKEYHRSLPIRIIISGNEKFPLYFTYRGKGSIDFFEFILA